VSPLLIFLNSVDPMGTLANVAEARPENQLFWPAVAAISAVLAVRNHSRLGRLAWPPHIICLVAYLAFAGTTVLWAFSPAASFTRFGTQVMMVTSIVLPAMLAARTTDMMRGLFLTFALGSILNFIIVVNDPPIVVDGVFYGYQGYFTDKNTLGECASVAFLLALHEMLYPGLRRASGVFVVVISAILVFLSNSKTSLGLAILSPLVAAPLIILGKKMRISPAMVVLPIPFFYIVLSRVSSNLFNHISWMLYGNYTFSGRTFIWDFVEYEIARRPLLGWGYLSFWQVGPDGPSFVDGWGWIKRAPHAHNGYLDTKLAMGYIGFALLLIFIFATLHAARRLVDRDPARAWLVLSLALYNILSNFLESTWLRGGDPLWVVFVILVAEIGRYWQPIHRHSRRVAVGDRFGDGPASAAHDPGGRKRGRLYRSDWRTNSAARRR
jgi:O-antigen ligase